ncbi:CsiV family protein [Marinobacter fonticola]|uniref:CsiV family protein n=1 Tax=Marinobacter fonticola TaxID=2603215 RepID=UPI0011E6149A|nr:CsiV family protein [Marinobacter fonticola]
MNQTLPRPARLAQKREYGVLQDFQNRWLSPLAFAFALLSLSGTAFAQDNLYRAELVLFERLDAAASIGEQMQTRRPDANPEVQQQLWVAGPGGRVSSDLSLIPRHELTLTAAAARLENSGRYRVLMASGWVQSFPPDYQGEPMRVSLGNMLDEAGEREVQGYIDIDRLRYLHVTAHLDHWQPVQTTAEPGSAGSAPTSAEATPDSSQASAKNNLDSSSQSEGGEFAAGNLETTPRADKELLTWLHETRRMRSEEIHYLDSPSLGLLVYFKPIKDQGGAQ